MRRKPTFLQSFAFLASPEVGVAKRGGGGGRTTRRLNELIPAVEAALADTGKADTPRDDVVEL